MKKPKISIKSFAKAIGNFCEKRCMSAICEQADYHDEQWPQSPSEWEPNELTFKLLLYGAADTLIRRYSLKALHDGDMHSSVYIPICNAEHMKRGYPEFLQLKYHFNKKGVNVPPGREVLEFKLFIKRNNCEKKRITMLQILL
ncbi:MAG: hypothetical protein WC979_02670 [Candidatus Pacearchaeota archaeon]|jgi:hypothetical protein|nr:hypothetical protein [Clostridia bacterium]